MSRKLTSRSSLESLRREAKRWLRQLRDGDADALDRFRRWHPHPTAEPTLRDVQLALARELEFPGWSDLKGEIDRRTSASSADRERAIEALLRAADRGDPDTVREIVDAHPDIVNERAELSGHHGKRTALHFAMNSMNEEVIEVLLAHGADPNIRDDGDNAMPIHFAAEEGKLAVVKKLVEHGADTIGGGDTHELEVIGWAVCFDDLHRDVAEYLLEHGARHTIFSAVAMGDAGAVRDIVRSDPAALERPMDRTNRRGRPLHLAVVKQQPAALDALIELGADTAARDASGLTPLDRAAMLGERGLAERLIGAGARVELPAAVALERRADIDRLLREDPHVLRPGGKWARLIIRAAEHASGDVIDALIRAGASVHARDSHTTSIDGTHGFTALHAAAWHGNESAARVLLRHGADPGAREDKYRGTAAGWANYNGQTRTRDIILDGAIDIWDAIEFRAGRIAEVLAHDPDALNRPFQKYVNPDAGTEGKVTPIAAAVMQRKLEAARLLIDRGADLSFRDSSGRTLAEIAEANGDAAMAALLRERADVPQARAPEDELVARFLIWASQDWRFNGDAHVVRMNDAGRLLDDHPGLSRTNIFTAVVCGETDEVRRILETRPQAAVEPGGPHRWPPLLYLCSARLPGDRGAAAAVDIARLLLDHGADPNAFYFGGNADIHYTAFTCVMGRGEDLGLMHPRAPELVALLLERGADPHDNQVLYNVFADNTSRHLLDNDIIWLLDLMYEHSVRRGHKAQWDDPTWPMFDMRGAPSLGDDGLNHHGAHLMLHGPVTRNLIPTAKWMLDHGAGPDTPFGSHPRASTRTLYQEAMMRGHGEMAALLARYGARGDLPVLDTVEQFVLACLRMDGRRVREMIENHRNLLTDPRALQRAIELDRDDVVGMLLDLNVSPDLPDEAHGGHRPLHAAGAHGAVKCARLLIARGADVDARESTYQGSPLTWAAHFGHREMVELLGQYARDVWHLTYTGRVDRLREVLHEEPERARVVSSDGSTPLMWLPDDDGAALEITKLFLDRGANGSQRNDEGETAADIAEQRGMSEVAKLLRGTF